MSTLNNSVNVSSAVANDEIDLMALFSTLWRGKWLVVLCAVLAILLGGFYAFSIATPMYPARAVIALESQEQAVVDIESVLSGGAGGSEEVNTEVEVIKSRVLLGRLVDRLSLVNDPEFNAQLREPSKLNPIAVLSRMMRDPYIPTEIEAQNKVIDSVLSVISVANIRQSLVFNLSATTTNPTKSALIANTLAEIYIEDTLDKKRVATERASVWLSEKAVELKAELETSELSVTSFKDKIRVVSVEALGGLSRQLKDLRGRLEDTEAVKIATQARVESMAVAISSADMVSIAQIAEDAQLSFLANENNQIGFDARLVTVLKQAENEAHRAEQQFNSLTKSEQKFREEIESQSRDLLQLQQLIREAKANGLLYQSFLTRLKETSIQTGLQQPDSRLLSAAVPRPASAPRKGMILVLSAFLGIMLGAGLVLLKELRNSSFRTADDLEAYTGYQVLGSVPRVESKTRLGVLEYTIDKPTSAFAEAIRNIRTSVLMSNIDKQPQVIMSTSSVPSEGKTTQSLTLAQNMAGLGKKVLVVEGDLRKRIFSEYFDTSDRPGILSVMSGGTKLETAVFKHEKMGVDLLFADKSGANAADIFSSDSFANLLADLRKAYDYIIIDTAPVLAVPDARIIGTHVDAIVYTVLWDKTTKAQVRDGLAMFASVGLNVTGLVLGNVDAKQMKKYGYYGSYNYSGYYEN